MKAARQAYVGLTYIFLLGVVLQVFLAGVGIFGNFGDDLDPHRDFGFFAMHLIPLLIIVASIVGKMRWTFIGLSVLLFAIIVVQPIFLDPEDDDLSKWINAVHPTLAIVAFALAHHLAQRSLRLVRGEATWGAEPVA
ncbi:MAG TPA: DUF6220 domain-containing protein [Dehalococcoidia bacterium]|nr:DUF6220 domain-containing protein [Dehalococcoidia bacterium]